MSQQIQVEITVNGKKISPFSHLTLRQQFNGHHYFELRFNHDVLENPNEVIVKNSKSYLGKPVSISMKEKSSSEVNLFKGIVTDIGLSNSIGSAGDIVFKGYSPTILLEAGPSNKAYTEKNLKQIFQDAVNPVGSDLSGEPNPKHQAQIPYVVQYKETTFEFLRRLAAEYGEWFFYSGSKFLFGKPRSNKSIELKFPRDISSLNMNVKVAPLKFEQVDYFSRNNEHFKSTSQSQQVQGLSSYAEDAVQVSDKLFSQAALKYSSRKTTNKSELDQSIKTEKSSRSGDLVYLQGASDSPYIALGTHVTVTSKKGTSSEDFGKFMVTAVVHGVDGLGNYHNSFEAIPASVEVVPNHYEKPPVAEPQMVIVRDNKDPKNLGRVRVQLLWAEQKDLTPWIKVMSPHTGTRGDGSKNRGIFFTPEIEDYVIVGFNQNDINRPFVMGSVPHGKAIDTAKNSDNHIKAIRTRTGSTIYFKDKDNNKEQEIVIKTDDENIISILVQNQKGTISIKSNKDITVTSEKNVLVKSEKIKVEGKTINIEASDKIELKAQTINIEGSQKFNAKSMNATMEGSTSAKVKSGAQVDIDGGGMANIKAGIVKIN